MLTTGTKICYIRGGTYNPPSVSPGGYNGITFGLLLTSADNGERWSYYPPDGYDTAILNGGSTGCNTGIFTMIGIDGGSNITVDGLQIHHASAYGIGVHGGVNFEEEWPVFAGTADSDVARNNIVHDITCPDHGSYGAISGLQNVTNFKISHNYVYNMQSEGPGGGGNSDTGGLIVEYNFIDNVCLGLADCAGIGSSDNTLAVRNTRYFRYNYVRNWAAGISGTPDGGLYYDNGTSYTTGRGNVITGNGGIHVHINGGNDNLLTQNIFDLLDGGWIAEDQFQPTGSLMRNNVFNSNIIVGNNSANGYLGQALPDSSYNPTIVNGLYWKYGGGTMNSGGVNGDGGCIGGHNTLGGACVSGDQNPTVANPLFLTCPSASGFPNVDSWSFKLNPSSPAFSSPVNWPSQPDNDQGVHWGEPGYYGPPGFRIPHTGAPPTYGPTC